MPRKNRLFAILLFSTLPLVSQAQNHTSSPYSRFGFGELMNKGFSQNRSMGGLSVGLRLPNFINYQNPASYSTQDTMSFLFDVGLTGRHTKLESETSSRQTRNLNFDHLAMSFPLAKWMHFAAGITSYSDVGYELKVEDSHPGPIRFADFTLKGEGGLNQFFFGASVKPLKNLSIGMNAQYLFGSLYHNRSLTFPLDIAAQRTDHKRDLFVKNMNFQFGAQYTQALGEKHSMVVGAIFGPEKRLGGTSTYLVQNLLQYQNGYAVDTVHFREEPNEINFPMYYGAGISYNIQNKLIAGIDYRFQEWSRTTIPGSPHALMNNESWHAGFQYIPDYRSLRNYFQRIQYRAGGFYQKSYIQIDGYQLDDYGMSFGLGLPLGGSKTMVNLSYELGQRGKIDNIFIKETYGIFSFNITLYDFWFYKQKYD